MVFLVQILYTYVFYHGPATGITKGDEASPSIILAGRALLVKMLINIEPFFCFFFICLFFIFLLFLNYFFLFFLNTFVV